MKNNLIRVNIILTKEQKAKFTAYTQDRYSSLSEFLRKAGEEKIENETIYKKMIIHFESENARLEKKIDKIQDQLDTIGKVL